MAPEVGASALAFALTFMVVAARSSNVAILDDSAHRWAPWVLLVTGAVGAGAPLLWPKDGNAGVCAVIAVCTHDESDEDRA